AVVPRAVRPAWGAAVLRRSADRLSDVARRRADLFGRRARSMRAGQGVWRRLAHQRHRRLAKSDAVAAARGAERTQRDIPSPPDGCAGCAGGFGGIQPAWILRAPEQDRRSLLLWFRVSH